MLPRTGLALRKRIIIKTIALIQTLAAAGLAISISQPVLAEEIGLNNAPIPAALPERMNDKAAGEYADKHLELREKWENMSPEERTARRKTMREHWEKMPPEERDQLKHYMGKQDKK